MSVCALSSWVTQCPFVFIADAMQWVLSVGLGLSGPRWSEIIPYPALVRLEQGSYI